MDASPTSVGVAGTNPQARRGGKHTAGPEPTQELVWLPHRRSATVALSFALRTSLKHDVPHRTSLQVPMGLPTIGPEPNPSQHSYFPSPLVHPNQGRIMPAARAIVGQFLGRSAIGDRSKSGHRCGLPLFLPLSLSFSLFPLCSSLLSWWHSRPDARPVPMGVADQPLGPATWRARRRARTNMGAGLDLVKKKGHHSPLLCSLDTAQAWHPSSNVASGADGATDRDLGTAGTLLGPSQTPHRHPSYPLSPPIVRF